MRMTNILSLPMMLLDRNIFDEQRQPYWWRQYKRNDMETVKTHLQKTYIRTLLHNFPNET